MIQYGLRVSPLLFKCHLITYFPTMYPAGTTASIKDSNNTFINREVDLEVLYGLDSGRQFLKRSTCGKKKNSK